MTKPDAEAEFWDRRFETSDYLFGKEPNAFLKSECARIPAGSKVLCVADGEGRNGVYLAEQGYRVVATDISAQGIAKSQLLADERGVAPELVIADVLHWEWPKASYDAVVAIFVQFAEPGQRSVMFKGMVSCLRDGGLILMQGYRPKQLDYRTGGPPNADNMYTRALLEKEFANLEIELLRVHDSEIAEGKGHCGMSALIDLVARKTA